MSDLANNIQGEHFSLPATAAYWRVRRLKEGRGAPEVVFGHDGGPLLVAVETDFDALRAAVDDHPGRYRLDALDETRRPIEGIPAAYVAVPTRPNRANSAPTVATASEAMPSSGGPHTAVAAAPTSHDALLAEVIRGQNQLVALMTERFSGIMVSAAELLRVFPHQVLTAPLTPPPASPPAVRPSDGPEPRNAGPCAPGGLEPSLENDECEGLREPQVQGGMAATMTAVNNIVGEVMPVVKLFMAHRMTKATTSQPPRNAATRVLPVPTPTVEAACPLSLAELRHLDAIDSALSPGEARRHQLVTDDLPPNERRDWLDTLCALDVEDALALIRRHIARAQRTSGAAALTCAHASPPGDGRHPLQEDTDDPSPGAAYSAYDDLTEPLLDVPNQATTEPPTSGEHCLPCDSLGSACTRCDAPSTACEFTAPSRLVVTPPMIAHAMAVQAALTPAEGARVLALAAEMPDDDRQAWMAELSTVTVADAVQAVREVLTGLDGGLPVATFGPLRSNDEPDPTAPFLNVPEPTPLATHPASTPITLPPSAPTAPEPDDR